MHRPKHIAEYILLRLVAFAVNVMPQSVAIFLGSALAKISFSLGKSRQKETQRRIRQVFGEEISDAESARIAATSFRELIWHTIEILRTPKVTPAWVKKHWVLEDEDRDCLENAVALNKGVLLAVVHLGNWDLGGVALQQLGYPMTFIVRQQKNPLFDQYLNRMRGHRGSEVIERDDPMLVRKVIRALKKGHIVAILVDLRARQPDLEVTFLGHTADLARGVGLISHLAKCPVVPTCTIRLSRNRHQWRFHEAIVPDPTLDRNADAERIMRQSLPPLEAAIRAHPEQYFWFNKRWVLEKIPSDERAAE